MRVTMYVGTVLLSGLLALCSYSDSKEANLQLNKLSMKQEMVKNNGKQIVVKPTVTTDSTVMQKPTVTPKLTNKPILKLPVAPKITSIPTSIPTNDLDLSNSGVTLRFDEKIVKRGDIFGSDVCINMVEVLWNGEPIKDYRVQSSNINVCIVGINADGTFKIKSYSKGQSEIIVTYESKEYIFKWQVDELYGAQPEDINMLPDMSGRRRITLSGNSEVVYDGQGFGGFNQAVEYRTVMFNGKPITDYEVESTYPHIGTVTKISDGRLQFTSINEGWCLVTIKYENYVSQFNWHVVDLDWHVVNDVPVEPINPNKENNDKPENPINPEEEKNNKPENLINPEEEKNNKPENSINPEEDWSNRGKIQLKIDDPRNLVLNDEGASGDSRLTTDFFVLCEGKVITDYTVEISDPQMAKTTKTSDGKLRLIRISEGTCQITVKHGTYVSKFTWHLNPIFVDNEPAIKEKINTNTKGFAFVWSKNPNTVVANGGTMFISNEDNFGALYVDVYYDGKRITDYTISGVIDELFYTTITDSGRIRIVSEQNSEMTLTVTTSKGTGSFVYKCGVAK